MEMILGFVPMFIMQTIYAIFVFQIAKRTGKNAILFAVATLIPIFGAFFFIYVFWSTILYLLDSINELRGQAAAAR